MESNISNPIPTKNNPVKIDHYLMTKILGKGSSSIVKCKLIFLFKKSQTNPEVKIINQNPQQKIKITF